VLNKFTFVFETVLLLKSTLVDGRLPEGKFGYAGNKTKLAQAVAGIGLIKDRVK